MPEVPVTIPGPPPPRMVVVGLAPSPPRERVAVTKLRLTGPPPPRHGEVAVKLEGEPLLLTADPELIASEVASIYELAGRPHLEVISDQLRASRPSRREDDRTLPITQQRVNPLEQVECLRSNAEAVADLWDAECARLDGTIRRWLVDVEDRATTITLARLRRSRADVLAEGARYLTGFDETDPRGRRVRFDDARLTQTPAVDDLRAFLQRAAEVCLEAREALGRYDRALDPWYSLQLDPTRVDSARRDYLGRLATSGTSSATLLAAPLLDCRSVGRPRRRRQGRRYAREKLRHRIIKILRQSWDASWTVQELISAMPARANLRPGWGAPEEELAAHLDDEDEAGP
jgi:hypothetical protein